MDEFIVYRVDAVFHRPLIKTIEFEHDYFVFTPRGVIVFFNFIKRWTLGFWQVTQKCKYDAVFFLHRITVNLGTPRGLFVTQRGHQGAFTITIVLPAVIRARNAIGYYLAFA
jgi:hypothetical protein